MFLYKIKKKFFSWAANIQIFKYPMFCILFGDNHYKIKGTHMRKILNTLKPGDILLRKYDHYLGSRIIPGYWSHAAIFVGRNKVVQMLGIGISTEDILTFMRCDDIAILRHNSIDAIVKAVQMAEDLADEDIKYDYDFKSANDKFYCTELVAHLYDVTNIPGMTHEYILPDDMLNIPQIQCVWAKDPKWVQKEKING